MTKITAEQKIKTLNEALTDIEQSEMITFSDARTGPNKAIIIAEIEQLERYLKEINTLEAWENAQKELANAQSYSFSTPSGNRTVQKVDAMMVSRTIAQLRFRVNQLDPDNSYRSKIQISHTTFNSFYQ